MESRRTNPRVASSAHRHTSGVISRRRFLLAGAAGASALTLDTRSAGAGTDPVMVEDPTRRRYGPVLFIGDSTSSRHWSRLDNVLADRSVGPYRCDLQPGRSISRDVKRFPSGVEAVRSSREAGFDPPAIVVALGANDLGYATESREQFVELTNALFSEIGTQTTIGFFNLFATVPTRARYFNAWLLEAQNEWPNLLVLDWASLARRHPQWHAADGFHYNYTGAEARNAFMARAMIDTFLFAHARHQAWPKP